MKTLVLYYTKHGATADAAAAVAKAAAKQDKASVELDLGAAGAFGRRLADEA